MQMIAKSREYSLSILTGPADVGFIRHTVPHLVRSCKIPVCDRALVVDTLPVKGRRVRQDSALAAFLQVCEQLRRDGYVDRVILLGDLLGEFANWSAHHFGKRVSWIRDFRGVPLFGWVAGIEQSTAQYHLHFDSDILIHQDEGEDWIASAIEILRAANDVLCVAPHPGPPPSNGQLRQTAAYQRDARGFFRFQTFSSRRFLIDRQRFASLLPLRPRDASRRHRLRSVFGLGSPLLNWELMVQERQQELRLVRAHLTSPGSWSVHVPDHGAEFCRYVRAIIQSVESGRYPPGQAGHYDLRLADWLPLVAAAC